MIRSLPSRIRPLRVGACVALVLVAFAGSACAQAVAERPTRETILPGDDPELRAVVADAHRRFRGLRDGANADYIPALAEVDSDLYGVALVTADGAVYEAGDARATFSIQSVSKAFVLALVMQELGAEAILEKVGADATGAAFNSIVAIESNDQRSINSLVNAGAIATTSLVPGDDEAEKWDWIVSGLGRFAARPLAIDEPVCRSELETNQRNQAIAKLLEAYGRIYDEPVAAVDRYTRQCALSVSALDLATMGATLAAGGVNPRTGERVIDADLVPHVLAVMATAGLYEKSGTWLYTVGLPAKSGVGGGIVAVAPGRFGVAAFSPPLDAAGNSVRAQAAIRLIAERLGANVLAPPVGDE